MTAGRSLGRRARGWWYPWVFVAFMAVVVVVNGVLAYLAMATWPGLETERAYERGLVYNRTLAEERAQTALGWRVEMGFSPSAGAHAGEIEARVLDRDGRPLDGLRLMARIQRPVQEGYDRDASFEAVGDGRYRALVALPLPGQWTVRMVARGQDGQVRARRRINVP